jgi:hypothetical protein
MKQCLMPLLCHYFAGLTAAGWQDENSYVPAVRIEKTSGRKRKCLVEEKIEEGLAKLLAVVQIGKNIWQGKNCCMITYSAQRQEILWVVGNVWFLLSPALRMQICIGCISFQPSGRNNCEYNVTD